MPRPERRLRDRPVQIATTCRPTSARPAEILVRTFRSAAMTLRILLALPALLASSADLPAQDWSQWRGPTGDNHATAGATLPAEFGPATNAVWRTPVPGRGHSSPTVVGDRVYLTTALTDTGVQALLAFDRATGAALWTAEVHQGGLPASIHPNNTHATPTVAADGERAYVAFHTLRRDLRQRLRPRRHAGLAEADHLVPAPAVQVRLRRLAAAGRRPAGRRRRSGQPRRRTVRPRPGHRPRGLVHGRARRSCPSPARNWCRRRSPAPIRWSC